MKYILINSIGDYPEDFLFAKVDIEKKMIEDNDIEKRMKLDEFIIYINIQDKIYMNDQKSIAFNIIDGLTDQYVFYSFLDSNNNEELFDSFKKKLEKMNFDINAKKLSKLEPLQLLEPDILNGELFMINFEIFK